jgi:hypothetical protein
MSLTLQFKEIYPLTKQSVLSGPSSMDPQLDDVFKRPDPPPKTSTEETAEPQRANRTEVEAQIKVLQAETAQLKAEADRLRRTGDASLQDQFLQVNAEYSAKQIQLIDLQNLLKSL